MSQNTTAGLAYSKLFNELFREPKTGELRFQRPAIAQGWRVAPLPR